MSRLPDRLTRRSLLAGGAAAASVLSTPALAQAVPDTVQEREAVSSTVHRNTSAFLARQWQPHFPSLRNGAILVDIQSRVLHLWQDDGTYHLYPSSVPQSESMTRRGRTRVVQKVVGPSWRPTPNMRRLNPEWPAVIGPGPDNPLGSHALYLSWTYYRIHGTHDTRKIGRRSSSGCIGLYNEHIAEVFGMTKVGTQVLLI